NVDNPDGVNVAVRGLQPTGLEMRPNCKIVDGRWFQPGQRELVVGSSVAKRFPGAAIGKKVQFARGVWEVVGTFDAARGAQDSEMWGDLNQLAPDLNRPDALSSALVQATDPATAQTLVKDINNDQRLGMQAISE